MSKEPNKETPYTTETAIGKVTVHPLHPIEKHEETAAESATDLANKATSKLQSMKENIAQVDWREQVRERPVAFSVGALSLGLLAGYSIASGRKKSGGKSSYGNYSSSIGEYSESDYDLPDFVDSGKSATKPGDVTPSGSTSSIRTTSVPQVRTTSGALPPSTSASSTSASSSSTALTSQASMPTMSAPIQPSRSKKMKAPKGKSMTSNLFSKLQGTSFLDRLQTEAEKLGNQVVDEISNLGHNVLLPAVTNKIKEAAGEPSANRQSAQSSNRPPTGGSSSSGATTSPVVA